MPLERKRILVFGGTGSLGCALIDKYVSENKVFVYSRDESKHWNLEIKYNYNPNLEFIIGDVRDYLKVEQTMRRIKPHIIIIAAAMKHIDRCEYEVNECIDTNLNGIKNVLDAVDSLRCPCLDCVCFISTDKACSPVNVYGMCKGIAEAMMVEKSRYMRTINFVTVRYGNVLNSRGSIIPTLHRIGQDPNIPCFKLTDERMTRFVMTLEQSVQLIEHAIRKAKSGDIVIPELVSMKVKDLMDIFSELYDKPVVVGSLRPGEKMFESLINETQSSRMIVGEDGYMYIKPNYITHGDKVADVRDYNSTINPLSKDELHKMLKDLGLLHKSVVNYF